MCVSVSVHAQAFIGFAMCGAPRVPSPLWSYQLHANNNALTHTNILSHTLTLTHTTHRQWLSRVTSLLLDKNGDLRKRASEAIEALYFDVDAHTVVAFAHHSTGAEGVSVS